LVSGRDNYVTPYNTASEEIAPYEDAAKYLLAVVKSLVDLTRECSCGDESVPQEEEEEEEEEIIHASSMPHVNYHHTTTTCQKSIGRTSTMDPMKKDSMILKPSIISIMDMYSLYFDCENDSTTQTVLQGDQ
jgi:hypothetical protein